MSQQETSNSSASAAAADTARASDAPDPGWTARAQVAARFEALDLFVPAVGDDRIDWLARRFSAREFERVDFLRIDSEGDAGLPDALYFGEGDFDASLD